LCVDRVLSYGATAQFSLVPSEYILVITKHFPKLLLLLLLHSFDGFAVAQAPLHIAQVPY
jgi:hypothetical protein